MAIHYVTDDNFDDVVMKSGINNAYGERVTIAKVNVDENPNVAIQQQVMSIPTLKFIKNGKVIGTSVGFNSKEQLENVLNSLLVK